MQAHDLALRFALSKPEGYMPVFLPSMTTVGGKNGKSDTETQLVIVTVRSET